MLYYIGGHKSLPDHNGAQYMFINKYLAHNSQHEVKISGVNYVF